MRLLVSVFLVALSLQAQVVRDPASDPLQRLQGFLGLSDSQIAGLLANNIEYNGWASQKRRRISQVQTEIAEETSKEPLDPGALGIRYAEIETICRQLRDRAKQSRAQNLDLLSPEQRARLKVLEDAMALAPVVAAARSANVLGVDRPTPALFVGIGGVGSAIIEVVVPSVNGCEPPSGRSGGDEAGNPPNPSNQL